MTTILLGAGASIPFFNPPLKTDYLTEAIKNKENWSRVIERYNTISCDERCRRTIPSMEEIMSLLERIVVRYPLYNFEQIAEVLDKYCSIMIDLEKQDTILSSLLSIVGATDKIKQDIRWQDVPFLYREIIAETIIKLQKNNQSVDYANLQQQQDEFLKYLCDREEDVTIVTLNYDDCILTTARHLNFTNGFTFIADKGFIGDAPTMLQSKRIILFPHGHLRLFSLNNDKPEWYHSPEIADKWRWELLLDTITDGTKTYSSATFAYNFNTFITTGQTKDDSLNYAPFAAYYQRMAKDIMNSDKIIIIGYSFSDKHFNRLLKTFLNSSSTNKVLIVDWYPYNITMVDEYKAQENIISKIRNVFSPQWSVLVDEEGHKHSMKQPEIERVNTNGYGEIFENIIFYKKGYREFLNHYKLVLQKLYKAKPCFCLRIKSFIMRSLKFVHAILLTFFICSSTSNLFAQISFAFPFEFRDIEEIIQDTTIDIDYHSIEELITNETNDSIKNQLRVLSIVNKSTPDTLKVKSLWNLMLDYENTNQYAKYIDIADTLDNYHTFSPIVKCAMAYTKANMFWRLGDYEEGEKNAAIGKELYLKNECKYDSWFVEALEVEATIKYDIPKLDESIALCDSIIQICKRQKISPLTEAKAYSHLASVYCDLNQKDETIINAQKSFSIFQSYNDWKWLGIVSNTLAILYFNLDEDSLAENYFKQALDYRIISGDTISPAYIMAQSNYAMLFLDKNPTYAISLYRKLKQDALRILGENHPWYGIVLHNLGVAYHNNKQYDQAEKVFLEVKDIRSMTLGHLHHHNLLLNKAFINLYYDMQQWPMIISTYDADFFVRERYIKENFMVLSEKQRESLWEANSFEYQHLYPSLLLALPDSMCSEANIRLYNLCLLTKGFLLGNSTQVKSAIVNSGDSILKQKWMEYVELKEEIAALEHDTKENQMIANMDSICELTALFERYFYKQSKDAQSIQKYWSVNVDSVRIHLNNNEIAIEFLNYSKVDDENEATDTILYYALILTNTDEYPHIEYIGTEDEVLQDIDDLNTYDEGGEVHSIIWDRILDFIHGKNIQNIYFSAAGVLHNIPMESLPVLSGNPIQNYYNLIRLSSTRQIVLKNNIEVKNALVYGGINYEADLNKIDVDNSYLSVIDTMSFSRSAVIDSTYRSGVKYLKGAEKEARYIDDILRKNRIESLFLSDVNATENSFKYLSNQKYSIVHVATHGFFSGDSESSEVDPLNRCGLLFAGANMTLRGNNSETDKHSQDGILTAKEISLLDLNETGLVVLSACETGKGKITGEGVFGLQRGFKMAGAQTLIMSLWKVDDAATQLLMTEFYRNWITNHQSKREAFRNAQNTVRSKYEEPYYWAGFIMLD